MILLSILLFIVGGCAVLFAFAGSLGEPGYGGVFKTGFCIMGAGLIVLVYGLLQPSKKK